LNRATWFRVTGLAAYAAHEEESRGRRYTEPGPAYRSEYQRDRDRIVHSTAFRRLVYKTQVFVNHEGDLYRTRLTHTLEVAQIARTIAQALALNEVLSEAICLAHDVGHTPFGHAGQDALNECMMEFGGFEHNLQSLRVVDELEEHYADFNGLNLSYECREGILKHCSHNNAVQLGELGERFIKRQQPGLEAQLANFADEIAYNNHDVDDGIRAGLITVEQLLEVPLFREFHSEVLAKYPELATPIRTMASAFQQAGITDADSSDLLGLCLGMAEGRTTAYLMYGPQSAASLGKEMAQSGAPPEAVAIAVKNQTASDTTEYQAYAGALDTVLRWRLTNMYGLDDASAQALVQSVSRVPVTAFSSAGVQVPAYLQLIDNFAGAPPRSQRKPAMRA